MILNAGSSVIIVVSLDTSKLIVGTYMVGPRIFYSKDMAVDREVAAEGVAQAVVVLVVVVGQVGHYYLMLNLLEDPDL